MKTVALSGILCCCVLAAATIKQPAFFARRDYPAATGLAAVADINGDGIPDVIAMDGFGIQTLFGNGNGTFRSGPATNPGGALGPGDVVPIDLNGDGKIDLVIAQGAGFEVCFGNGDGSFQSAVPYGPGGGGYLVVQDFNGDGIPDVIMPGSGGIWLYTGKGGGLFNQETLVYSSTAVGNATVAAADFNGDGKLDLVVASSQPSGFMVLFGNGNGTFQTPVLYAGPNPTWVVAGDLNDDGHPDIVVSSGNAYVYLNTGHGQFSETAVVALAGPQIAIGKINGDNNLDLVSSGGYVALGLGHGRFATPVSYAVEASDAAYNVVLADLTKSQNGLNDVVVGKNGAVSVMLNAGNGTRIDGEWTSVPGGGNCGAAADFNGDGKSDLAMPTTAGISVLLGTGNARALYTEGPSFTVSGGGCPITADLNGDGIPDLLVGANGLGGVGAYLGNGDGTFQLASVIPVGSANVLVVGDFNHDGKLDFADSSNEMALGNGDGTFQTPVPILADPPVGGFVWIAAGDLNNDGWTDLFATQSEFAFAAAYVMLNNQQGGFTLKTIPDAEAPNSVTLADLNGDGNLDAVIASTDAMATVLLGNGKGEFAVVKTKVSYPFVDQLPTQVGDVNGDGIPDLILPADGSVGIALGKGNGTFLAPVVWGAGPGVGQVFFQNLHGQSPAAGLPDIVAPDSSGGVLVLLNVTK